MCNVATFGGKAVVKGIKTFWQQRDSRESRLLQKVNPVWRDKGLKLLICPKLEGQFGKNLGLSICLISGSTAILNIALSVAVASTLPQKKEVSPAYVIPPTVPTANESTNFSYSVNNFSFNRAFNRQNNRQVNGKISSLSWQEALLPHENIAEGQVSSDVLDLREKNAFLSEAEDIIKSESGLSDRDRLVNQISPAISAPGVSFSAADLSQPNLTIPLVPTAESQVIQLSDRLFLGQQPTEEPTQQEGQPTPGSTEEQEQLEPSDSEIDPELGRLRLREQKKVPRQRQPVLHFVPRISYFYTNNIFSGVAPIEDSLLYPSLTLWAAPKIGSSTYLTTSIDGSLIRYINESDFNYNLLRSRVGVYQRLTSKMYGEVGWTNQLFFRASNGDRFLNEHFVYLSLGRRDWLNKKLALDSYFDVRAGFADPQSRSRIANYLSVSLNYYLLNNLQVGADYQFSYSDYTKRDREDLYQRFLAHLNYQTSQKSQINLYAGYTLGGSTDRNINYDGFFLSVTYSIDWAVFD